nr:YbjN domain-containing protein [uncultured Hyphomonas sp.]
MRTLLTTAALAAAVSFPASAQEFSADTSLANDDRVVRSVSLEDLKAIAVSEGHTITEVGGEGDISLRATNSDGLIFHLIGTACDTEYAEGCLGMMVQVRYDSDEDVTAEKVNDANLAYAAVSTWWDKDGETLGITRYIILDGGQRMENVKINLQNALALGPLVADVVWPYDAEDDEYNDWLFSDDEESEDSE